MNYTKDGTAVIDSTGKEWPVNVWHEWNGLSPLPTDVVPDHWAPTYKEGIPKYWLVRPPLPELPREKTQDQIDCEALQEFRETHGTWTTDAVWFAALAYERARKPFPNMKTPIGTVQGFCWNGEEWAIHVP